MWKLRLWRSYTNLQVWTSEGRRFNAGLVLLDTNSAVPNWLKLSLAAIKELKDTGTIWTHSAELYSRVLVHRAKKGYVDSPESTFENAVEMVKALKERSVRAVDVYFPQDLPIGNIQTAKFETWVNTAILSNYKERNKTIIDPNDDPPDIEEINCLQVGKFNPERLKLMIESAKAALYARDLGNKRGSTATPLYITECVLDLFRTYHAGPLELEILSGPNLQLKGLNLLHAVGKGASDSPRLITISYTGDSDRVSSRLAIVGKCLTFDTGGLNLKPTSYIEDMYLDKAGACAALGVLTWVARTHAKVNLTVTLAVAENSISSRAMKPGDILKSLQGHTVEVTNTDAEGRLAIADALTYTQQRCQPSVIIDLATLTGSCVVALVRDSCRENILQESSGMTRNL